MAAEQASQWHFHHLLKWLHMFNLEASQYNAAELSDGVTISNILHSIDPLWFNENWLAKIKGNVGANKILKVSNLKKVLERVIDFYEVHLDQRLTGFATPDVTKIGESEDESELCRLLQLVLGCAVHCEHQEEFIQAIRQMEEDVQRAIMAAIQALPGFQDLAGGSLVPNSDSFAAGMLTGRSPNHGAGMDFQNLLAQLELANEDKKLLTRQCSELKSQITHLQDEIQHLQTEIETSRNGGVMESLDKDGRTTEVVMLKRQIQHLTDELLRSDSAKEEFRMRTEVLEQELDKLRMRHDELQNAAEQNRSLKDEVDILRERSARLATAECTIDSMRKKVEESNDLKRQLRKLEEKNAQYIQQNVELEEELKKLGPWKSQLELQKKQIAEVQAKLDEERKRADKFEFQHKTLQEKFETLVQEKERLISERDKLKDLNEELKYAQLNHGTMRTDGSPSTNSVDTLDMIPPEIKEKLLRLQHENKRLREQQEEQLRGGHGDKVEVLQTVIDGLQDRIGQLEAENRCACNGKDSTKNCSICDLKKQPGCSEPVATNSRNGCLTKPVFAGSISTSNTQRTLTQSSVEKASASRNDLSSSVLCKEPLVKTNHVERLKEAFLANSEPRVFQRSVSYGYDKALGFSSSTKPILDTEVLVGLSSNKWDKPKSDVRSIAKKLETSLSRSTSSDSCALRQKVTPALAAQRPAQARESEHASNLPVQGPVTDQSFRSAHLTTQVNRMEKPPPPPVDAVVITRGTALNGNVETVKRSGHGSNDEIDSRLSSNQNESPPNHLNSLLIDFSDHSPVDHRWIVNDDCEVSDFRYGKQTCSSVFNDSDHGVRSIPDDAIEIDLSFRGRGSVDSESVSVSSFSIISEPITVSERSFDRSHSVMLTPRSNADSDTVSRKSFMKAVKKKKMFKAAANAMFSLCGP